MTAEHTVESLSLRHKIACEFKQPLDEKRAEDSLKRWIKACGGPDVTVRQVHNWQDAASAAWATSAARDASAASAARDASAASAASAAWDAWAARDAWAASAARAARDAWAASAARAARDAWDASWASVIAIGSRHFGDLKTMTTWLPILESLEAGVWFVLALEKEVVYIPIPKVRMDDRNRLHHETDPAFVSMELRDWYWHGVLVSQRVIEAPETITVEEIASHKDQPEIRRVLIERYGWQRYLQDAGATVIDYRRNDIEATREALIRSPNGETVLVCACPSTARRYALEVPPTTRTCVEAQDWLSGGLAGRIVNAG
ncbi:MAG: DUF6745 domain-containing protein [Phycisphaerales bacterium]